MRCPEHPFAILALALLAPSIPTSGATPDPPPSETRTFDAATKKAVIHEISIKLRKRYVYAKAGASIAAALQTHLFQGAYVGLDSSDEFARRLTIDLVAASGDQHLQVVYDPGSTLSGSPSETRNKGNDRPTGIAPPFGFERIEILPGNIGYLRLTSFAPIRVGAETARAAMEQLAESSAIIIDVRDNPGGSPTMIPLIASYFFDDEPIHLVSVHWRGGLTTTESWTHHQITGSRMPETPLFVLTSIKTFSVAEELAYSLKHLGRATIVGQRTRGGAHRGGYVAVGSGFTLFVPTGATVSRVTGTNWEGVGVLPDIDVPADEALKTALIAARQQIQRPSR